MNNIREIIKNFLQEIFTGEKIDEDFVKTIKAKINKLKEIKT